MEDVILQSFPRTDIEALALLYVQNQDLTNVTPEELLEMYDSAVEAMENTRKIQDYASEDWLK